MIARMPITTEEFEEMCYQFNPCELVRGEVIRLSPGGIRHSRTTVRVTRLLDQWCERSNLGRVFSNETGFVVEHGPDTVRGADVAFISYQRLPAEMEPTGFSEIPAELVVEIVGKGQGWRHMVEKAGEYLAMGVDRVWIIDPKARTVHIFQSDAQPLALSEADTLEDEAILPGFSCQVQQFFEDAKPIR